MTHSKNNILPKLRFPEFKDSGDWEEKKLGDVISYFKGFAFKSKDYTSSGRRIVRVSDMDFDYIKQEDKAIYIKEEEANQYQNWKLQKDDLIVTTVGSKPPVYDSLVGRTIVVKSKDEGALLNQNAVCIRANKNIKQIFLNLNFKRIEYVTFIESIIRGNANQGSITLENLFQFKLFIPSKKEEQKKIADFLSSLDDLITAQNKKLEALKLHKKGLLQNIFPAQGETVPKFRFPEFKDSAEWEEKTLEDLSNKVNKKNKDNLVNIVLSNSAIQGIVSQKDYFDRDIANQNNLESYYVVELNDFVYNPRISVFAPVGPIKRNKLYTGVMSPLYTIFRFKNVNLDFMEQFFLTNLWHDYLKSVANQGARFDRMAISTKEFFLMNILIPQKEEQIKIADCLSSLDNLITAQNKKLDTLKLHKKGLMQRLFPVVKEAN